MFLTAPEGDVAAVMEAEVLVKFYCALVGEGYVEEGGYVGCDLFTADVGDEVLRIAAAGIGWVGADGAELAEAGELHAFACHGYEFFLVADAVVVA